MKLKTYLTYLFINFLAVGYTQYHSLPTENAVWSVLYSKGDIYEATYYGTEGDTLINTRLYTKILSSSVSKESVLTESGDNTYEGAFREENKIVYFVKSGEGSEQLMYDFTMNIGDPVFYDFSDDCLISDSNGDPIVPVLEDIVNENLEDGLSHEVFKFSGVQSCAIGCSFIEDWISGVGSSKGILFPITFDLSKECDFYGFELLCLEIKGEVVFQNKKFENCSISSINSASNIKRYSNVFPNPFDEKISIQTKNIHIVDLKMYSSIGNRLNLDKNFNANVVTINTKELDKGLYLLQVLYGNGKIETVHMIKQ